MSKSDDLKLLKNMRLNIYKKEDYIVRLWNKLDNVKIKEYRSAITEETSKQRSSLLNRIEKNNVELKKLKVELDLFRKKLRRK